MISLGLASHYIHCIQERHPPASLVAGSGRGRGGFRFGGTCSARAASMVLDYRLAGSTRPPGRKRTETRELRAVESGCLLDEHVLGNLAGDFYGREVFAFSLLFQSQFSQPEFCRCCSSWGSFKLKPCHSSCAKRSYNSSQDT